VGVPARGGGVVAAWLPGPGPGGCLALLAAAGLGVHVDVVYSPGRGVICHQP
jgi:hypothetical protein